MTFFRLFGPCPRCLLLVLACLALPAGAADRTLGVKEAALEENRVALVIGNGSYKSAPLRNPVNDARAMAQNLKALGFQVILRENLGQRGMVEALRQFGSQLREGGVGLFFFAGHGMQVKGRNFLIPVDADIQSEDEVAYLSLDANQVLDKMDRARSRVNLVILDACRNNPFARSFRSAAAGLAQMEAPSGTLIAFATAPGSVAADGEGRNSVYTKHLLVSLATPGLPVEIMFKRVRENVTKETEDRQTPWESSSLKGDFFFRPAEGGAQQGGAPVPAMSGMAGTYPELAVELAFWDSVKDSGSRAELQSYLDKYPQGQFAALARQRLALIKEAPARPVPPAEQEVIRGWMGVEIRDMSEEGDKELLAQGLPQGVLVVKLASGGPAEQAGLRPGDVIAEVEGRPADTKGFSSLTGSRKPGSRLTMKVARRGAPLPSNVFEQFFRIPPKQPVELIEIAAVLGRMPREGARSASYKEMYEQAKTGNQEVVARIRGLAQQGDVEAQFMLGFLYRDGQGVTKNPEEATHWFRQAGDAGHGFAYEQLGIMLYTGRDVEKNFPEALRLFRLAADKGGIMSMNYIGVMHDKGEGVTINYQEALSWYRRAADKGDRWSMYNIGRLYELGRGVVRNRDEAIGWYRRAAERKHPDAESALKRLGARP